MDSTARSAVPRYALSFTTGALLSREAALLAPVYLEVGDWGLVRDRAVTDNLLQVRTRATGVRRVRETVQRLSVLRHDEIALLAEATASERAHLMWAAACRRYALIGEFAEEVVRERYLVLAPALGHEDFDAFVRTKALWHEELAEVQGSTLRKLRSNVFRMMDEAEFLTPAGELVAAVLSERVTAVLGAGTPSDLRFFPVRLTEVQEGRW